MERGEVFASYFFPFPPAQRGDSSGADGWFHTRTLAASGASACVLPKSDAPLGQDSSGPRAALAEFSCLPRNKLPRGRCDAFLLAFGHGCLHRFVSEHGRSKPMRRALPYRLAYSTVALICQSIQCHNRGLRQLNVLDLGIAACRGSRTSSHFSPGRGPERRLPLAPSPGDAWRPGRASLRPQPDAPSRRAKNVPGLCT